MASFDGVRDWWEHLAPRERSLLALLGVTFVVCIFGFVGFTISDGLADIDAKNEVRRDALDALGKHRTQLDKPQAATPAVDIGDEATSLPTYLGEIADEVGFTVPGYSPQPTVTRGRYEEVSVNIELRDVTLEEVADFLQQVETRSSIVVVTNLKIEKSFRKPEELRRVAMTVSTYRKTKTSESGEDG